MEVVIPDAAKQPAMPHAPVPTVPYEEIKKSVRLAQGKRSREKLVCECTFDVATGDASTACGDDCLNRMLNVECLASRCPCGEFCTNQQFQRGSSAAVEVFDAGPKGRGLRALEKIPCGSFVYEYCGEVVDTSEFQRRAGNYALEGLRHYYFMTLDSDTVIDATRRGNKSRFINHSCAPNAETQKWNVAGYTRVGFFAVRDIAAGEEVTFDYKYERYGDAAQTCYCGAANCRGVLGQKRDPKKGGGKRRRVDDDFVLHVLQDKIATVTDGNEGLPSPEATVQFMRLMLQTRAMHHRRTLLDVLLRTESQEALNSFVNMRGLHILQEYLVEDRSEEFLKDILLLLLKLPINTRNLVDASEIDTTLKGIEETAEDEVMRRRIEEVRSGWESLKTVYVIPKSQEQEADRGKLVTQRFTISREERADFSRVVLQDIGSQTRSKIDFARDKPGETTKIIEISGTAQACDDAILRLKSHKERASLKRSATEHLDERDSNKRYRFSREDSGGAFHRQDSNRRTSTSSQYSQHSGSQPYQAYREPPQQQLPPQQQQLPPQLEPQPQPAQGYAQGMPPEQHPAYGMHGGAPPLASAQVLPPNWKVAQDEAGLPYYYNEVTRQTQWDVPMEVAGLVPAQPAAPAQPNTLQKLLNKPDKSAIAGGVKQAHMPVKTPEKAKEPATDAAKKKKRKKPSAAKGAARKPEVPLDATEEFRKKVSEEVVKTLNRYRKGDCKVGRITNKEDFKHVARKITKLASEKAIKRCEGPAPKFSEQVAHKVRNFVKEYMKKCGSVYSRAGKQG